MNIISRYFNQYLFWPLFFISHLLMIGLLSWHLLAQINFAYPLGYKLLHIDTQIQEFAPHNRHKQAFEYTTPEEHWELFAQITTAIQNHGKGLAAISYKLPNGTTTPFMHNAEVIHLQDVANLVDTLYTIGMIATVLWIFLLVAAYRNKFLFPPLKKILFSFTAGIAAIAFVIFSMGATKVFYWFHTKIFPDGHQWFFYYEDSLMTTLMKAPDIFGFIAILLLVLIITFWAGSIWASNKLLVKHYHQPVYIPSKKRKRKHNDNKQQIKPNK